MSIKARHFIWVIALTAAAFQLPQLVGAQDQGVKADYERAKGLRARTDGKVYNVAETPVWHDAEISGPQVGERRQPVCTGGCGGGGEEAGVRPREARSGAIAAANATYTAITLPFTTFTFVDNKQAIEFAIGGGARGGGRGAGAAGAAAVRRPAALALHADRLPVHARRRGAGGQQPAAPARAAGATPGAADAPAAAGRRPKVARVARRQVGGLRPELQRRHSSRRAAPRRRRHACSAPTASEGDAYTFNSIAWSPDSKKIAAYRRGPATARTSLRRVVAGGSAAAEVTRPELLRKPGDVLDVEQPVLFDVATSKRSHVDNALFPNAYEHPRSTWRKDSRAFTFEYNQRGHQLYRVIEVERGDRQGARGHRREQPDVLRLSARAAGPLLFGQKYRYDIARRQGSHLDVGARRLEPPLSLRRRDRPGEEPDHEGRLGGARRRPGGRGGAADLVHGERHGRRARTRTSSTTTASTSTARG